MSDDTTIQSVLSEDRIFDPPADFAQRSGGAWIESIEQYRELHAQSVADPEAFWGAVAEELHWFKHWEKVVEWECPDARWFTGGKINACHNCVDRHVDNGFGDQPAIIWEGEPVGDEGPEIRTLTYADMQREVSRFANALKAQGVGRGDVVTIYMGLVPEVAVAVLACARIGAPHSVIFGGFSA
ncbi:MAG: AMP-binding protein, partial [Phycisphaerales bacterium]|nr:AMP-binding protein [Phycisphaerales bacterium]